MKIPIKCNFIYFIPVFYIISIQTLLYVYPRIYCVIPQSLWIIELNEESIMFIITLIKQLSLNYIIFQFLSSINRKISIKKSVFIRSINIFSMLLYVKIIKNRFIQFIHKK